MPVTVQATIKAAAGKESEVRSELKALIGPTRKEEGCINYDLHESAQEVGTFLFYENWRSKEDLDAHLAKPHIAAFIDKADDLLAEPIDIHLFTRID